MSVKQDLRTHIKLLDSKEKLHRITKSVNKDTELMPLVRWQFRGLEEEQRRGFLFENVTDSRGRTFSGSVAVGIYAASTEIYSLGMGCPPEKVRERWLEAQARPIPPNIVESGPVHEEVHMGDSLLEHGGIEEFPIPISTPGFDIAPYTTASNWVTKDLQTGWTNVGNYRGQVKGPDRMGMFISPRNHGWNHWDLARQKGIPLEAALVIGGPPTITFTSGSRIPYGVEEYAVAGSLLGEPIDMVRCKTVDLLVPAYAELVIEGRISTEYIEPEAPFGEYTGYMGPRVFNAVFEITAITHRKNPIFCAIISQMPPSESSKMKKIAQDNNYLHYLRNQCNLPDVLDVTFDEIAVDSWCVIRMRKCNPAIVWQALYAVVGRNSTVGKMVIAVDEDIDPSDMESVVWALSYRVQPEHDMRILPYRSAGLDPSGHPPTKDIADNTVQKNFGSVCLVNAMRKFDYPPVSLPAKPHMEQAKKIWEELGLPRLKPRVPWHGYELGEWSERDREEAEWAIRGEYSRTGERAKEERKPV
ncbi:UbiD family decarboxylase [Paenibacillus sp. EPM92]|uniref:UbiD family decarboxylase n=1 Tax=Paenibacillus sp. EPM92 TaxID=1561195 RepID=UPI001915B5F8|nr:UbiD family decarboxylase [Paenibacillus sp. EPM92]